MDRIDKLFNEGKDFDWIGQERLIRLAEIIDGAMANAGDDLIAFAKVWEFQRNVSVALIACMQHFKGRKHVQMLKAKSNGQSMAPHIDANQATPGVDVPPAEGEGGSTLPGTDESTEGPGPYPNIQG